MVDTNGRAAQATAPVNVRYDRSALSYANSFDSPLRSRVIRTIEWMTGKISVIRMIRQFERRGPYLGQEFWTTALDVLGVDITTPEEQLAKIPQTGPVILVANHPHGMVDGMVLAEIIGRRRLDYKILTRSLLTQIDTVASQFLIAVPFPHHSDAQERMVEMRRKAMEQLKRGGMVALFPSGVVATSKTMFGPVVEEDWNVFTAKMIRNSGATVVPCYFHGANSRWYQMAHQISPTLRQSLLIHEIVRSKDTEFRPIIGDPITPEDWSDRISDPRQFMAWLREETLALGQRVGTGASPR